MNKPFLGMNKLDIDRSYFTEMGCVKNETPRAKHERNLPGCILASHIAATVCALVICGGLFSARAIAPKTGIYSSVDYSSLGPVMGVR
jgi:hypothetical protein